MQLFHYTDVTAVKSILDANKLWLTDMRFLNDSQEMNHGIEHVLGVVKSARIQNNLNPEGAKEATNFVVSSLGEHVDVMMDFNPIFVCSFSKKLDLLSQWRAYGNYAIEFCADSIGHHLSECAYEASDKAGQAYEESLVALKIIGRAMQSNSGHPPPLALEAYSVLIKIAATFKHESFSEEQEVRIIVEKTDYEHPLLFRGRSGLLIPYVEVPIPFESIKAIHIGPMRDQELAYRSMQMFVSELVRRKESEGVQGHPIAVFKSDTPFRSA